MLTIPITPIRVLITLLTKSHDPPRRGSGPRGTWLVSCLVNYYGKASKTTRHSVENVHSLLNNQ